MYKCWRVIKDQCKLVDRWDRCSPFFATYDNKEGCLKLLAEIKYCDPDAHVRIDHINMNHFKAGDINGAPGQTIPKITWDDLKNAMNEAKNDKPDK